MALTKKVASSPQRHTFQKERYIKHCEEEGKLPNPDYIKMYQSWREQEANRIEDTDWQKNNLEYDLRSSKELCDKAKASESYSQNLYAAMCNMTWQSREFWQEMKGETWSCSWRHAGGIVADMREEGDYIDWYCSGIAGGDEPAVYEVGSDLKRKGFVPEGVVTEEIELDLNRLGWRPIPWDDDVI